VEKAGSPQFCHATDEEDSVGEGLPEVVLTNRSLLDNRGVIDEEPGRY
jgi:hypothetical protein